MSNTKKIVIILILLIFCSFSSVHTEEFAGIFTSINPSATNVAFGLNSGTANIWNQTPLGVWSNPAKLGYFEDFSWGWIHDGWFEEIFPDIYFDSSYLTYGKNGLGFMVPFINNFGKFGTSFDYGKQIAINSQGQVIDTIRSYEINSQFAVGINCFQFFYNFLKPELKTPTIFKNFEIFCGYSYDYTGHIADDTKGYGINLKYDFIKFQYN